MFSRGVASLAAAILAAGSLIALPGCDWFQGSESEQRQGPYLSSLNVSPSTVLCAGLFSISFRYDDPQGDIATVRMTFQRVGDAAVREETPAWPEEKSRSTGTVTFEGFSFPCDATAKGGVWAITVQAADDRSHPSNILTGQIRLNAPG